MAIFFCFIPLILLILLSTFYFKLKITHQLIAVLIGLIAVFPIAFIQFFIPGISFLESFPVLSSLLKSLFLYGLVEEICKTLFIVPLPHKNYSLKHFLLLIFIMGLSLGCFESTVYFLDHLQIATQKHAQLLYKSIFIRIFTTDIIHMCCTGICGLFIFSKRLNINRVSYLFTAIIIHGIYDFFAVFPNNLKYFSFIVILLAIIQCRIKYLQIKDDLEG